MKYFTTHAGKGVLCIAGSALLLAVPIALPWVAAVILLQAGIRHLRSAFQEIDRDVPDFSDAAIRSAALGPTDHSQRGIGSPSTDIVRTRS